MTLTKKFPTGKVIYRRLTVVAALLMSLRTRMAPLSRALLIPNGVWSYLSTQSSTCSTACSHSSSWLDLTTRSGLCVLWAEPVIASVAVFTLLALSSQASSASMPKVSAVLKASNRLMKMEQLSATWVTQSRAFSSLSVCLWSSLTVALAAQFKWWMVFCYFNKPKEKNLSKEQWQEHE